MRSHAVVFPLLGDYQLKPKNDKNTNAEFPIQFPEDTETRLYSNIEPYLNTQHPKLVANYKSSHDLENDYEPRFFRNLYLAYILDVRHFIEKEYQGDDEFRKINPEKAAAKMDVFLGKNGLELYLLALEEEINSVEYMNALLHASTECYTGPQWLERPVVIIAGPSGSGKSSVGEAMISEMPHYIAVSTDTTPTFNRIRFVDGGIARDISQIRKATIKLITNYGYTGFFDLHEQSKIIETAKMRMYQYAIYETNDAVMIPETFSYYGNIFTKSFSQSGKMLKELVEIPNSKLIFARIISEDEAAFKDVVNYLGNSRAWKTQGFDEIAPIEDLNDAVENESKAYGASGFGFGVAGSLAAENWVMTHAVNKLMMVIINDLRLLKWNASLNAWLSGSIGDENLVIISKRAFDHWKQTLVIPTETELDLLNYIKQSENRVLPQIYSQLEYKIRDNTVKMLSNLSYVSKEIPSIAPSAELALLMSLLQNFDVKNIESIDIVDTTMLALMTVLVDIPSGRLINRFLNDIKKFRNDLNALSSSISSRYATHQATVSSSSTSPDRTRSFSPPFLSRSSSSGQTMSLSPNLFRFTKTLSRSISPSFTSSSYPTQARVDDSVTNISMISFMQNNIDLLFEFINQTNDIDKINEYLQALIARLKSQVHSFMTRSSTSPAGYLSPYQTDEIISKTLSIESAITKLTLLTASSMEVLGYISETDISFLDIRLKEINTKVEELMEQITHILTILENKLFEETDSCNTETVQLNQQILSYYENVLTISEIVDKMKDVYPHIQSKYEALKYRPPSR